MFSILSRRTGAGWGPNRHPPGRRTRFRLHGRAGPVPAHGLQQSAAGDPAQRGAGVDRTLVQSAWRLLVAGLGVSRPFGRADGAPGVQAPALTVAGTFNPHRAWGHGLFGCCGSRVRTALPSLHLAHHHLLRRGRCRLPLLFTSPTYWSWERGESPTGRTQNGIFVEPLPYRRRAIGPVAGVRDLRRLDARCGDRPLPPRCS